MNWLRFQWQLKSVQKGNDIIIVVAVVAVRFFLFNCCGNYFSNIMDHKFFWSKNRFYPKKNLAQKRCWFNKMLGQKIKVKKKLWSSKILITYSWYGQMSPKQFWSKKMLCSKNLSETKFWAKKLRLSKNWAKKVWSKLGQ